MDFADRVKRHMAGYKRKVLNVEEDGVWRGELRYLDKVYDTHIVNH